MRSKTKIIIDNFLNNNPIFLKAIILAPLTAASNSLNNALAVCLVFTCLTYSTIFLSSILNISLPYALKSVTQVLISALIFVPVTAVTGYLFKNSISEIGMYLSMLIINPIIVNKAETRFFKEDRELLHLKLILYIASFDAAALIMGVIRDFSGNGVLFNIKLSMTPIVPSITAPFAGVILLGFIVAGYKKIAALRGRE